MAILLVDPKTGRADNAKPGDYVVTGGGIYQKTETGSVWVGGIDTPTGTSKSFSDVVATYNRLISGGGGSTKKEEKAAVTTKQLQDDLEITGVDDNGILSVSGYDPTIFPVYIPMDSSGGNAASVDFGNIAGYVILGLVGIALLDRIIGGGR